MSMSNTDDEQFAIGFDEIDDEVRLHRVNTDRGIDLVTQSRRLWVFSEEFEGRGQQIVVGLGLEQAKALDPVKEKLDKVLFSLSAEVVAHGLQAPAFRRASSLSSFMVRVLLPLAMPSSTRACM